LEFGKLLEIMPSANLAIFPCCFIKSVRSGQQKRWV
jgi:hypothetical protein